MDMRISQEEAADLLRKWMEEDRVVHLTIRSGNIVAKVLGRIDQIDDQVHFSQTKTTSPLGSYTSVLFPLSESDCSFEYSDAQHAPEWLREKLAGYDALLYVYCPGIGLGFAVLPPLDEWAKL
jgi:hypothetical protein